MISEAKLKTDKFGCVYYKAAKIDQHTKVTKFENPTMISEAKLKTDKFGCVYYKAAKIDQHTTQCEKQQKALQKHREKYKSKKQALVSQRNKLWFTNQV